MPLYTTRQKAGHQPCYNTIEQAVQAAKKMVAINKASVVMVAEVIAEVRLPSTEPGVFPICAASAAQQVEEDAENEQQDLPGWQPNGN